MADRQFLTLPNIMSNHYIILGVVYVTRGTSAALYRGNRIEKMSILHYFKLTISLPNPNGLLKEIKPTTIQKVNEKVLPLIERQKIGGRDDGYCIWIVLIPYLSLILQFLSYGSIPDVSVHMVSPYHRIH